MKEEVFTSDELTGHHFEHILENFRKLKFSDSLDFCAKAYDHFKNPWFLCAKAEVHLANSRRELALNIYQELLKNPLTKYFHSYISLQIAIVHYNSNRFNEVVETISEYLKKHPVSSVADLIHTYLLCQLNLYAHLENGMVNKADELIENLEVFPCAELEYLKVSKRLETNPAEAFEQYKNIQNRRPFHASRQDVLEVANSKDVKEVFKNSFLDELDATHLLYHIDCNVRYELEFNSLTDMYGASLKLKAKFRDIAANRVLLLSPELKKIVSKEKTQKNGVVIQLKQSWDRWYGDYTYFSNWVYGMLKYMHNTQFLVSELYENWVDHYQVTDGIPRYCRYHGRDSFYYEKLLTYEKIVRKNPSNENLKKIVSDEFYTYGNLGLKELLNKEKKPNDYLEEYRFSLEMLEKSLKYNPENGNALTAYGKALFHISDLKKSERFLKKATELSPNESNAWYLLGKISIKQKDFQLGESRFKNLFSIPSDHLEVTNLKIEALQVLREAAKKNSTGLKTSLTEIENKLCAFYTEKTTDFIRRSFSMKNTNYTQNRLKASLKSAEEKILQDPNLGDLWVQKANCLYHLKEYKQACKAYKKAIKLGIDNKLEVINWMCISLGYSKASKSAMDLIDDTLRRTETPRSKAILLGTKAWLNYELEQFEIAYHTANEALRIDDTYYYSWYIHALIHAQNDSHEKALKCIGKAISLDVDRKKMIREESDFQKLYDFIGFWDKVL